MAKTLTFALTPSEFQARVAELAGKGITLSGNTGTITYKSVVVGYWYNGTDMLTVAVEKHPFFEPEGLIDNEITNWFRQPA